MDRFTCYLLVTCQLRSFLGLASQIHHIVISTNTRFRSVKVGNKFNFNIFPMINSLFLKLLNFTLVASITISGNAFQWATTLCEKLYFLLFVRQCFLYILYLCPLVVAVLFLGNMVSISTLSIPFMISKVSTTSALILLYCSVGSPRCFNLLL